MDSIINIFHAGGFVMWPLLLCSVATWGIVFERLWTQRNFGAESTNLANRVQQFLEANEREKALEACIRSDLPIARVMEDVIRRGSDKKEGIETIQKRINRGKTELNIAYRRYLWILGTIGSATPFLGLFGTVVGILRAFRHIAETGDTGFSVVAGGISEALIATAAGIIVAVIAVAFYNFLQVKATQLATESRLNLEAFLESWMRAQHSKS